MGHPQNSKSLQAESNSSKRGLTIHGTFTPSDRAWEWSVSNEDNRADVALTSSEQELRLVVETIPALVWKAGPDGNFEYVNKRVLEYIGAPLHEIIGWGWMEKVPDDIA